RLGISGERGRAINLRSPTSNLEPPAPRTSDLQPLMKHDWSIPEIDAIYNLPLLDLVFRAQTIHREHHRPNEVQGCMLLSIKTGGCPEDCAYCPQSARYKTGVTRTDLVSLDELTDAATRPREHGA